MISLKVMRNLEYAQHILDQIEFSGDGFVKRHPTMGEYQKAMLCLEDGIRELEVERFKEVGNV